MVAIYYPNGSVIYIMVLKLDKERPERHSKASVQK
jgi:hypothetical protein